MKMKDFYLTLLSDSSLNMFADNKQSEFTVRLDRPIHIEEERWEVALVEISTPSEVLNITEENNFFFLTFLDQRILNRIGIENITEMCSNHIACDKYKLSIPTGNYVSPEYLAEEMQSSIDNFEKGFLKQANAHISVTFDAVSQHMKIAAQDEKQVRLLFPKQLGQILGLDPTMIEKPIGNEQHIFKFNVDLHHSFRSLFIYSDIADFTFVGDVIAPILRVVLFNPVTELDNVHKEFKNLHYVPVSKSVIDQVHISIKTETGSNVPFVTGKTIIKLRLRRRIK